MPSQSAAHARIDEGIKRGPRRQINRQPKAALTGQYLSPVTPERKQQIIEAALLGLAAGLSTDQIGEQHGITGRALRYWLLDDERAQRARLAMINQELARTGEDLRAAKHADSPLPLACAREEFRYWSWIAERREARLYGPKQEVTHQTADMSALLQAVSERLLAERQLNVVSTPQIAVQHEAIEADLIAVKSQVIDNT